LPRLFRASKGPKLVAFLHLADELLPVIVNTPKHAPFGPCYINDGVLRFGLAKRHLPLEPFD
jgi:hypothetical protein